MADNENKEQERFIMPDEDTLIEFAIVCLHGKIDADRIGDMVVMTQIILDRLYEHGHILTPSSKELKDES